MNALVPTNPAPVREFVFEGMQIRLAPKDGRPWFYAGDLCRALGYRAAPDMTRYLKDREKGTLLARTPGGEQVVSIVSEPGLYRAILNRGTTARAMPGMAERIERFKDRVVEEVLPAIRETGSYALPSVASPQPVDPMALLYDVDVLLPLLATMAQRAKVAEAAVEASRPAVDFVEALAESDGTWGLQAAGKALHQGPNRFVAWLRERGDLFDLNGGPVAKETLIKRGLSEVVWAMHGGSRGRRRR